MAPSLAPFLMFEGRAEEAMDYYLSVIPDSRAVDVRRHGKGGPGPEGSIMTGRYEIAGQTVLCSDSFVKHGFTFTPSMSLFLTVESDAEFDRIAAALVDGGHYLMPPDNYGFSQKFAWAQDRFGVSWQINRE